MFANNVHIAGRGSVVRQLRILVSQFRVLRTGTRSEIRPDNMYQALGFNPKNKKENPFHETQDRVIFNIKF